MSKEREIFIIQESENPNKYLSLAVDGAVQSKHQFPVFGDVSHSTQEFPHLVVTGVKVHGKGSYLYCFAENMKHDSNSIVECVHRTLYNCFGGSLKDFESRFPPHLTPVSSDEQEIRNELEKNKRSQRGK